MYLLGLRFVRIYTLGGKIYQNVNVCSLIRLLIRLKLSSFFFYLCCVALITLVLPSCSQSIETVKVCWQDRMCAVPFPVHLTGTMFFICGGYFCHCASFPQHLIFYNKTYLNETKHFMAVLEILLLLSNATHVFRVSECFDDNDRFLQRLVETL